MNLLWDEFCDAGASVGPEHFDALVALGVPRSYLWRGPMRFGVSGIIPRGEGTYEPYPTGEQAFIVPAIAVDDDEDLGDLIAWHPSDPSRWWCRTGALPIINADAIFRAAHFKTPLRCWSTPLRWLRAGGDGIVILSTQGLPFWLSGVDTIHADTFELGDLIDRTLRTPSIRLPNVLVPKAA